MTHDVLDVATIDGRRARGVKTRAALLEACRNLMEEGTYQPTMFAIAVLAGYSVRSAFQHFDNTKNLYRVVLEDPEVSRTLVAWAVGPELAEVMGCSFLEKLINALVFGEKA